TYFLDIPQKRKSVFAFCFLPFQIMFSIYLFIYSDTHSAMGPYSRGKGKVNATFIKNERNRQSHAGETFES
ncbi:MAG: hypothetical protein O7D30_10140, partial [Rickettsia endosymbiont of Ixodes persulcatus]|nr:hypothetical protein [Rickettsia endosymbiont of Ixodes persulcatus]